MSACGSGTASLGPELLRGSGGKGSISQTAGVNYVHYGHATDSSSIEVNQLQQIKRWLEVTETPIPPYISTILCCAQWEENPSILQGDSRKTTLTCNVRLHLLPAC